MLSRPFVVLFCAVLVATMGISMVSPILPVYAEDLGASGIWIGLTFSVFAVTQTVVSPFVGRWSDRYGRKPFIVLGLLFYLVAALGYLTADSFIQVLLFRAFSGCGTSLIFAVAYAYLGDMAPRSHEGRWFGTFSIADIAGFGVGPVFSGLLRDIFGFGSVFIGMAALMGASALLVFLLLPEREASSRPASDESQSAGTPLAALRYRVVVAITLFFGFGALIYGSVYSFLAVYLDEMGVSASAIGIAFGSQAVASGLAQPPFGYIADRFDRRLLLLLGFAASGVTLGLLGVVDTYVGVLVLMIAMGLGQAASQVAAAAIQVVAGRRAGMGTVIGIGAAGDGIGILAGGVVGGLFAGVFGASAAFYFGAGATLAGCLLVGWLLYSLPTSDIKVTDTALDVPVST